MKIFINTIDDSNPHIPSEFIPSDRHYFVAYGKRLIEEMETCNGPRSYPINSETSVTQAIVTENSVIRPNRLSIQCRVTYDPNEQSS